MGKDFDLFWCVCGDGAVSVGKESVCLLLFNFRKCGRAMGENKRAKSAMASRNLGQGWHLLWDLPPLPASYFIPEIHSYFCLSLYFVNIRCTYLKKVMTIHKLESLTIHFVWLKSTKITHILKNKVITYSKDLQSVSKGWWKWCLCTQSII